MLAELSRLFRHRACAREERRLARNLCKDAHEEDGSAGSSHRRPKFPSGSSALTSSIGPAHEEPTPATFTWHSVAQENRRPVANNR